MFDDTCDLASSTPGRRLHQVYAEPEPVRSPEAPTFVDRSLSPTAIAFDDVVFAYPGTDRGALASVSFDIAAGDVVALVGPSGAGKTTSAQLMLRFWDPDDGHIRLFGRVPAAPRRTVMPCLR